MIRILKATRNRGRTGPTTRSTYGEEYSWLATWEVRQSSKVSFIDFRSLLFKYGHANLALDFIASAASAQTTMYDRLGRTLFPIASFIA